MILVNDIKIEQNHFPDNSLLMKFDPNTILNNEKNIHIWWYYENDAELFALIALKRHLDKYFPLEYFRLFMPYIPNARQDRTKSLEDVFTLKYFCEIINSLNFPIVFVLDPHSDVSLALLNNVVQMNLKDTINEAIYKTTCEITEHYDHNLRKEAEKTLIAFYPDEGAMKRYSSMINMPYAFGVKKRDWETGKILSLDIVNSDLVKDKNVLIIDDICSRGGTFLHAAKALKEAGANRIFLYVTHAEKTMVEGEMYNNLDLIEHIYTTNSIFDIEWDDRNKVTIVDEF